MNEHEDPIDTLIRQNAARQLAAFDWEKLRRGIDSRLASAGAPARLRMGYGKWVAVAAAVALTAGVLVFAALCITRSAPQRAGTAQVEIIEPAPAVGVAEFSVPPAEKPVRCEVTILASDSPRRENQARASWCILARHESPDETPRDGTDASDVLCLF